MACRFPEFRDFEFLLLVEIPTDDDYTNLMSSLKTLPECYCWRRTLRCQGRHQKGKAMSRLIFHTPKRLYDFLKDILLCFCTTDWVTMPHLLSQLSSESTTWVLRNVDHISFHKALNAATNAFPVAGHYCKVLYIYVYIHNIYIMYINVWNFTIKNFIFEILEFLSSSIPGDRVYLAGSSCTHLPSLLS